VEPDAETLVARVRRALEGVPAVRVAYLFGSRVTGRARPDSDLDLAVLFDRDLDATARLRATLDVIGLLTDALGVLGERADILDLRQAGSGVGFRAIREGRRVIERDPVERLRIEVRIARQYDDEAPRRALLVKAAHQAAYRLGAEAAGRP
jgi:predicted nucleotidyltransferase